MHTGSKPLHRSRLLRLNGYPQVGLCRGPDYADLSVRCPGQGTVCRSVVGITLRVRRWLEVVEEREQAVGRPVAARACAGLRDAGEGLFLDGHVGVEVDLGGLGVLVAEPEG